MARFLRLTAALVFSLSMNQAEAQDQLRVDSTKPRAITFVIPCGTKLPIVLQGSINSQSAKEGDQVRAYARENIVVDGKVCVSQGALIAGRVLSVQHHHRNDSCKLILDHLTLTNGHTKEISATPVVRGGVLRVTRAGEDIRFNCSVFHMGCLIGPPPPVSAETRNSFTIFGPRDTPLELKPNDEFLLEFAEDIRD